MLPPFTNQLFSAILNGPFNSKGFTFYDFNRQPNRISNKLGQQFNEIELAAPMIPTILAAVTEAGSFVIFLCEKFLHQERHPDQCCVTDTDECHYYKSVLRGFTYFT